MFATNTLSDILSAEDGNATPIFANPSGSAYVAFDSFSGGTDPLAGKPAVGLLLPSLTLDAGGAPVVVSATSGTASVVLPDVAITGTLTWWQRVWNWIRNFFQYSIPGFFTSTSNMVRSWFGSPTTVTTANGLTGATTTTTASSSWLVYVFLAGAAAAVYFATKGKGGKGKSFISKLGGKSSVKLH